MIQREVEFVLSPSPPLSSAMGLRFIFPRHRCFWVIESINQSWCFGAAKAMQELRVRSKLDFEALPAGPPAAAAAAAALVA